MVSKIDHWLRRLDAVPVVPAAIVGVAAGTAAGAALLWDPTWPRAAVAAAIALGAIPLARAARAALEPSPPGPLSPSGRGGVGERLLEMVDLAGGGFWMGSKDDDKEAAGDEKPRHRVTVAPFAIGRYPVTQRQYREVMGHNPGDPQGDDLPINNVSWFDAVRFCNRLSEREGLKPAYRIVAKANEKEEVSWDATADGYRLPTEAEWEYACRAGTETNWSFGDDETQLGEHAWYVHNSENRIQPVGTKQPNPWRLFDMYGNVWEWCWDWFGAYPTPPSVGVGRVLRGGSWGSVPGGLRSAVRSRGRPALRSGFVGFRAVRGVSRQHGG